MLKSAVASDAACTSRHGLFVRRSLHVALLRAKTVALRPNSDDDIQHKRALISLNNCYMDVDDSQVTAAHAVRVACVNSLVANGILQLWMYVLGNSSIHCAKLAVS